MPFAQGIHYSFYQPKEIDPSRLPLILIHGAGGSFLSWHPYLRRLTGETVYAPDLPGHGESEGDGRRTIEEYADDIVRFMENLRVESAVIAGLSMGSGIALTLALKYPQRVRVLALLGSGAKLRVAQSTLDTIGNPETFAAAVEIVNRACFSSYALQDLVALSKKSMLNTGPSILLGDYLACNQFDVTAQLAQIPTPTLILCGADDAMTPPKYSHYLKDHLPNAQLHILEKTGHMLTLEQPDAVAKLLKKFLDEVPASSPADS
ncbi:MAG: alpha/beta hydrolase [Chloroflexi bacterium]|nr:alpha/beta hydrolase [Chloroflexota bacterium]